MARRALLDDCDSADLAALYWWRRDSEREGRGNSPLPATRLKARAAQAAPAVPSAGEWRGNRFEVDAAARRAPRAEAATERETARDPDRRAAMRPERRNAMIAVATGLIATAAPAAAAIFAAAVHVPLALGFAVAGVFAASFALYHALRWFLLMRSDALPNILA